MIVTITIEGKISPCVSIHGNSIKIDMGAILIETSREGFSDFVYEIIHQAIEQDVVLNLKR